MRIALSTLLLLAAPLPSLAAGPFLEKTTLFEKQKGGYYHYRIPSGVVSNRNRILFANPSPDDPKTRKRENVTVRLSYDEGKTWPVSRLLQEGSSGYSDLFTGPDGTIYCFYERQGSLVLARFNLEWVTGGKDSLKNPSLR